MIFLFLYINNSYELESKFILDTLEKKKIEAILFSNFLLYSIIRNIGGN